MKKAAAFLASLTLLGLAPLPRASAQVAAPGGLPFAFQEYHLRNGLRVILSADDSLPLVTVAVAYSAGTMREKPGQEGLAYLVENLMFQGSENVAPLQHVGYVQKVGGELNATTSVDKALFYQTVPSNYLALALWLESDRMRSLAITPAAIENTRAELIQEHRDRLASDPYLESFSLFDELLYPDYLYGHPLIAGGSAMQALTREEVLAFHRDHYVPNNAVLCIVGNIEIVRTKELVARYFDTIPPGIDIPPPPRPLFLQEDEVVRSLQASSTASGVHLGFRFFPLQTGDVYSLKILEYVLLKGETSRLKSRLLGHDPVLAYYLSGGLEERQGVLGLKIFCLTNNDVMAERAWRAILSELERFRTRLVPNDELDKAKALFKKDYLMAFSTRLGKALFLVDAALSGRSLDGLGGDLDKHMRVNPQTLMALVNRHIVPRNKVVLELRQK